ncbi:MAG TPA: glycine oxidase ThiO [Pyrinomonadaceae bacterium]|nr:glycine oxidase ThiO [Pyrinomonadaceae bacterium]
MANSADVLIIGGGVIGLSIARELHGRGVTVTLAEKSNCGLESSWAAGGILGPQTEAEEAGVFFDMCSRSRDLFPELAAELLDETGVDIELERSGTLYCAFSGEEESELEQRFEWQRELGLPVERLSAEQINLIEPNASPHARIGLHFPLDWQVENRKLVAALEAYSRTVGIDIRENTQVTELIVDGGRVMGAETSAGRIPAGKTVVATGAWTSLIKLGPAEFPVKVEPIRGQMICFQSQPGALRHVLYSERGYLVPRLDGRVLAGSTLEKVGFEKGVTRDAMEELREMAAKLSPLLADLPITESWSGLRPFAADGMPVIGTLAGVENLYVATAQYRSGILLAPLTAAIAAEHLIEGRESDYSKIFGPDRFSSREPVAAAL